MVRTQEKSCSSDSRFRRKLSETTGHRLLGTQRPQMLWLTAWGWFSLTTELSARCCTRGSREGCRRCVYVYMQIFGGTSTRVYARTQAHGATPELRRVAATTPHGLRGQALHIHFPKPVSLREAGFAAPMWECWDRLLLARVWLCVDPLLRHSTLCHGVNPTVWSASLKDPHRVKR